MLISLIHRLFVWLLDSFFVINGISAEKIETEKVLPFFLPDTIAHVYAIFHIRNIKKKKENEGKIFYSQYLTKNNETVLSFF